MIYLFLMMLVWSLGVCWLIAGTKVHSILKAVFVTLLLYVNACIFISFEDVKGWPSAQDLPERFELTAFQVQEPSKKADTPGVIYLWVLTFDDKECPTGFICINFGKDGAPRAYEIPYTEETHRQMLEFGVMLKDGRRVIVEDQGEGKNPRESLESENPRFYLSPDYIDEYRKG